MRVLAIIAMLLLTAVCADPATSFAAGTRSWCKLSSSCTVQG